jgi:hypothetical protein
MPLALSNPFRVWNTSVPIRSASRKLGAPWGTSMNSWKSRLFAAWAPPLITFINGTGKRLASGPPKYR